MSNSIHYFNGIDDDDNASNKEGRQKNHQTEYSTVDLNQSPVLYNVDANNNNNNNNNINNSKYTSFVNQDDHSSNDLGQSSCQQSVQNHQTAAKPTSLMTLDFVKNWGKSTFKCTKQMLTERLGKANRTVDSDLEAKIEHLAETKRKYEQILDTSRRMTNQFYYFINSQKQLGDLFADLSHRNLDLQKDFRANSEVQKSLFKNGEVLLSALNFFVSNLNTLCTKTIEDTMITIKQYELARLEFDAYRCDLEIAQQQQQTTASKRNLFMETQKQYEMHKNKYERLKADILIKMKFLDENRVKVMQKQLSLHHEATCAYFSGNKTALEEVIKQFSIKPNNANSTFSNTSIVPSELRRSFLEEH